MTAPAHTGPAAPAGSRRHLAEVLGLREEQVTDALLLRAEEDPLYAQHLLACRGHPELLALLLREAAAARSAQERRPALPGEAVLAGRALGALARWAGSGFGLVGDDAFQARLATCGGCEHLTRPVGSRLHRLAGTSQDERVVCGLCGCDVRRKARLPSEACPDGRWPGDRVIGVDGVR